MGWAKENDGDMYNNINHSSKAKISPRLTAALRKDSIDSCSLPSSVLKGQEEDIIGLSPLSPNSPREAFCGDARESVTSRVFCTRIQLN